MKFLLELKDDLVLISTWDNEQWYCWGAVHADAFFERAKSPWYTVLKENGVVIVDAAFIINNSMLPPQ